MLACNFFFRYPGISTLAGYRNEKSATDPALDKTEGKLFLQFFFQLVFYILFIYLLMKQCDKDQRS